MVWTVGILPIKRSPRLACVLLLKPTTGVAAVRCSSRWCGGQPRGDAWGWLRAIVLAMWPWEVWVAPSSCSSFDCTFRTGQSLCRSLLYHCLKGMKRGCLQLLASHCQVFEAPWYTAYSSAPTWTVWKWCTLHTLTRSCTLSCPLRTFFFLACPLRTLPEFL